MAGSEGEGDVSDISLATGWKGVPVQHRIAEGEWVDAVVECCRVTFPDGIKRRCYDLVDGVKGVPAQMLRTWPPGHGCEEGLGSCEYFSSTAGKWLKAKLLSVNFKTGQCDLNIKRAGLVRHLKDIVWGTFLTAREEVDEPPGPLVSLDAAFVQLLKRRKLQRDRYLTAVKPQWADDSRAKLRMWCEPDVGTDGGVWGPLAACSSNEVPNAKALLPMQEDKATVCSADPPTGVNGVKALLPEPAANATLYIAGLPTGITEGKIRQVLGRVGGIFDVILLPGAGTSAATVTFEKFMDAQWCREYLNGKIPSGLSSAIYVRYTHPATREARALRCVEWERLRARIDEEAADRVDDATETGAFVDKEAVTMQVSKMKEESLILREQRLKRDEDAARTTGKPGGETGPKGGDHG
jgi:hypothetical protein